MKKKIPAMLCCCIAFILCIIILAITMRNAYTSPIIGGADGPTLEFILRMVLRTPMGIILSVCTVVTLVLFFAVLLKKY